MKQFHNTAILTSQNPEAFLNFTFDSSNLWIIPDCCIGNNILYINGLDANDYLGTPSLGYALILDSSNDMASFHIYTSINYEFDTNLTFKFYDTNTFVSEVSTADVSILNRPYIINDINIYNNEDLLVDDEASYLLMRTNPKFTGNIVINIDSSNYIYLDTFKISDILSNKMYRRQKVSGNSVLSSDIRNIFSTLPLGELYRVEIDNTLDIAIPKTDIEKQFYTTYNYGAKLLKDELYTEDNAILAPLWINSKLPDYFAVFRLSGNYNEETYDGSSLSNLANKYLEESDIIKSWNMKTEVPLGKYLNAHMNNSNEFRSPLFLSLTDPTLYESDPNTWYGIAVDKGVITGRSETTYFFDQKSANYTTLNAFVSGGFERNTLVSSNLLNLQFLFNDEDVSLYSMNRYFGFYLTENVLYRVAYYSDSSGGPISILSLDGKDSSVFFNSSIFNSDGSIVDTYKNRIFVVNDGTQLHRITNVNQINDSSQNAYINNSYISKSYENSFTTPVELANHNPFIVLTLNNELEPGEHLRIINKTQNKIWEIYSIDASNLNCSRYCSKTVDTSGNYPTLYRTYFDISGDIEDQCEEIQDAFDLFAEYEGMNYFRAGISGNNWVSIVLNDDASASEKWMFQRISAITLNDITNPSSGFNNAASANDITFFGRFTPNASDYETISYDASYGPIDFELFGNRRSIMLDLFNRETYNLYSFESSANIIDKFEDTLLYQDPSLWYRKIIDFDVSDNLYQYIKDPLSLEDNILIMTNASINILNNSLKTILNTYSIYPVSISLMGINPVKDIDFTVYDSSELTFESPYSYKREDDASSYKLILEPGDSYNLEIPNSYIVESGVCSITREGASTNIYGPNNIFNTFNSSVNITNDTLATNNVVISYAILNGTYNYNALRNGTLGNEENINDYYDSSVLLKYGLTVPYISKWVNLGNDCRNNPLRLILNTDALDVCTNFIPTGEYFTEEISYPSVKYLSSGTRAWESYVFYDINDVIYDTSTSSYITIKDAIFDYPYIDYFSKLVYSNYQIDNKMTRSSIVYYNQYKNTIETIFLGLKLSFSVQNVAKNIIDIKNYDRYRFSFISTASRNKDNNRPIEVIINENTKTILMIWYQGNDVLNYTYRYSTYLPGKSIFNSDDEGFVTGTDIEETHYSYVKTPYYINNSTLRKSLINFYDIYSTYNDDTANRYAQFNKNLNELNSVWIAPRDDNQIASVGIFVNDVSYYTYNTFPQYVTYSYNQNSNTYSDYIMNYGYNYTTNKNWYTSNTTEIQSLAYFLSPSKLTVMYYILRNDEEYNSFDFGTTNPINISIESPRTYRSMITYNGWFKPKFNNIINFKSNEENELIDIVDKDFIFSNTNLRSYSYIPQMWYNKVTNTVTSDDVDEGNAIYYINNYNVFKSRWDASYYIKDDVYINGYESSLELPSFFGSKLPKFPNTITLENWNTTTVSTEVSKVNEGAALIDQYTFKFNLSRALINLFKNNLDFLVNWSGLSNSNNVIDSYINDTVISYYNMRQSKLQIDFYKKSRQGMEILAYTYNDDFILDEKQNFDGQLLYINDEYIYNIKITDRGDYSYFVKITLTEK